MAYVDYIPYGSFGVGGTRKESLGYEPGESDDSYHSYLYDLAAAHLGYSQRTAATASPPRNGGYFTAPGWIVPTGLTTIAAARQSYIVGRIELEEFEKVVEQELRTNDAAWGE